MRSPFDPGPGDEARSVRTVYANQTPPLLPSDADLAAHEAALELAAAPLDVLVLGVTPALFRLPWPAGSSVRAVDRSLPMIQHVWPGSPDSARVGDWTDLPYPNDQFDRIICDGGFTFFGPTSIDGVCAEVARVLRPGGLVVVRVYVWNRDETLDRVIDDVRAKIISTANEVRIRSWSALQSSLDEGVPIGMAFDAVTERLGGLDQLIQQSGLDAAQFAPFVATAGSKMRYTMWPASDLVDAWTRSGEFEHVATTVPEHWLGVLVPVLAFRRRPRG